MNVYDPYTDSLPDKWLRPKTRYHTCGTCKYVGVSEKDEPCINCINGVDMRKDLWQPKGE